MHHNTTPKGHGACPCLLLIMPMLLSACRPLRTSQDYDEVTDRRLLQIQEKCSRLFVRLEKQAGSPEGSAVKYVDFYEDVRTDIDVLRMRSRAMEKSEIARQQLDILRRELDQLDSLHRIGFHDFDEVRPLRDGVEGTLVSMQKYQFILKNRIK